MKRIQILILLIALIILTALITSVVYVNSNIAAVQTVKMDVIVDSSFAFNLDTDAIHFGRVVPGNTAVRSFIVNNTKTIDLVAEVKAEGELAPWITTSAQFVDVPANDHRKVNLTVFVPNDASYGKVEGKLTVIFKRVEP